jgi:hypothetical protein
MGAIRKAITEDSWLSKDLKVAGGKSCTHDYSATCGARTHLSSASVNTVGRAQPCEHMQTYGQIQKRAQRKFISKS